MKINNETFLEISGFPKYEISDCGRLRTKKTGRIRKFYFINGYARIDLSKNGKIYKFYVHRLVAQAFIPNNDNKPDVNHKDGNRSNNHKDNLEWATEKENIQHYINRGMRRSFLGRMTSKRAITGLSTISQKYKIPLKDLIELM